MRPIYLDHNATTPLLPEAAEAMRAIESTAFGNPSSAHSAGRKARQALENARECIADLLGANPDEVTFTSGATEANNLAVLGLAPPGASSGVIASHLEHPCVLEPLRQLETRGVPITWWPVNRRGIVEPAPLHANTRLICLMFANHETGAVQPIRDLVASHPSHIMWHCDAAQAVGKIPVNFRDLSVTTLSASAHKFGGPKGVGVLITKRGTTLHPLMFGGHQQQGKRPGTEPVALAVGMQAALVRMVANMTANRTTLESLRAQLANRLREIASPVQVNGPEISATDVVPTTLNISFPGCRADVLLMSLDLAGVACSTGSACSSGSLLPSPVLKAMGVPDDVLRSALRFSLSPLTTIADIDEAANRIGYAIEITRTSRSKAGQSHPS